MSPRYRAVRFALMVSAAIPARLIDSFDHDKIMNGAAHALWPTLAPLIQDMLRRKPIKTPRS